MCIGSHPLAAVVLCVAVATACSDRAVVNDVGDGRTTTTDGRTDSTDAIVDTDGGTGVDGADPTDTPVPADATDATTPTDTPDASTDPCAGITCSGRGNCAVVGGTRAICVCNDGYVPNGLACVLRDTVGGSLSLLAGALGGAGFVDGTGTAARFFSPRGIAVDGSGTVFVADSNNHMIRRVTAAGVVTTMAGRAQVSGLSNGSGATASFNEPTDIAMGPSGDLFVADRRNHQLRRISPAGDVSLFAGSPIRASGNADGLGAAARFDLPNSLAIDASGGLLVASSLYSTPLRTVTPAGLVSSLTSTPEFVLGLAVFANRSRAFRLEPSRVQEVSLTTGALTLIAGATSSGFTDATGGAARFNGSGRGGIATNSSDRLFVADANNNAIRVISYPGGVVTTLAGAAQGGFVDGTGSAARFSSPQAIAFAAGALYVTDTGNHAIRRVDVASGAVTTLAGAAPMFGSSNGTGAAARFGRAKELVADSAGNWYVADFDNNAIRRVTPSGIVSTLASGISSTGGPTSIAIDGAGNLYVGNIDGTLRRVTPAGVVSTLQSAVDATASAVNSIAVDASGTTLTWITRGNVVWRKVGAAAPIQLRSVGATGYFNRVAVSGGRTYLVYENTLNIIESDGSGIALAGCGRSCPDSSLDGVGSRANLGTVQQMVVASDGSVLWADSSGHAIRRAALDGTVTTVVGTLNRVGVTLGALPGILNEPTGVAVDPSGKIGILMGAPLAFSRTGGVGALLIAEL
jgi:hypothetical protein